MYNIMVKISLTSQYHCETTCLLHVGPSFGNWILNNMDNQSYFFVFWHMQLYMSWYIRSFFRFTFLDILYFFKYSCTNIFHRRSLYTFYHEHQGVSIHQQLNCLFNSLFRLRTNKTSKLCITLPYNNEGITPVIGRFQHYGKVLRKVFPTTTLSWTQEKSVILSVPDTTIFNMKNGIFNSLAPGKLEWNFRHVVSKIFSDWWLRYLLWNCPTMNVTGHRWSVNIGSGNGLVLSGNKPLPEPVLTKISVTIWYQWVKR